MDYRTIAPSLLGFVFAFGVALPVAKADTPLRFNRDIRPILTDKCFACHGLDPSTVEADLRLNLRESAVESGAIVPGVPGKSELIKRIESTDPNLRMPPAEAHNQLTDRERALLRLWIEQGAPYEAHWAYTPLERRTPELPAGAQPAHPVDAYIAAALAQAGVVPTPPADRVTLIRRLGFDLNGMPPTYGEVREFEQDTSDEAYARLVARLLDSPRYGERMAIYWLDLVRYADTVGYHGDQDVSQYPYRDYVIDAFNNNLPYDQFIREQLAGDLLPNATLRQQVASGYNRLNQTTEEGGAQAKEYLAIYFADRVRNVSQVFLGATMACAQCHDHKYDPYTLRDFYSLGAFFSDLEERGVYGARSRPPMIPVPTARQQARLAELEAAVLALQNQRETIRQEILPLQPQWEAEALRQVDSRKEQVHIWIDDAQDTGGSSEGAWNFITAAQGPVHSGEKSRRQQAEGLVQHFFLGAKSEVTVSPESRFFCWVYLDPENPPQAIMLQFNDGQWEHRVVWGNDAIGYGRRDESWAGYQRQGLLPETGKWVRLEADAAAMGLTSERAVVGMAFTQFGGTVYWDQAGWLTKAGMPESIVKALQTPVQQRQKQQADELTDYYLSQVEPVLQLDQQLKTLKAEKQAVTDAAPLTVVTRAVPPREIRILPRGNWQDDSGEVVQPAIPAFLGTLDIQERRPNRLDLAHWMTRADNPLTARTMANRVWGLLFGRGICSSVDDLGGQGTFPDNPELLDHLALVLIESGWDLKHLIRHIVTSEAYRRSSLPTAQLQAMDPDNKLFARQGRFRIDSEMIRDTALLHSGLLFEQVGGASAKPYQPEKYYAQLNFPRREYQPDTDQNQYRRGVYTHWQRTFLHPMLKAFDAPSREECTAARFRSNTPVQALVLLNDPSFVEAARVFAWRMISSGGDTPRERITWACQTVLSRSPQPEVVDQLLHVYQSHREYYAANPAEAEHLLSVGIAKVANGSDATELAAWTGIARVLFNLHETYMRY